MPGWHLLLRQNFDRISLDFSSDTVNRVSDRDVIFLPDVEHNLFYLLVVERFCLMHWGPKKMWVILQTFLDAFPWISLVCVNLLWPSSDNGLSPFWCQAIIWTNADMLLIGPLWRNFSEIRIKVHQFLFRKMCLKMLSAKWRPLFSGLSMLKVDRLAWHNVFTVISSLEWSLSDFVSGMITQWFCLWDDHSKGKNGGEIASMIKLKFVHVNP